jgi:hypothetical protein
MLLAVCALIFSTQVVEARLINPADNLPAASGAHEFLSADPMGLGGGANLYAYAKGQPTSLIDPSGLCSESTAQSSPNNSGFVASDPTGFGNGANPYANGNPQAYTDPLAVYAANNENTTAAITAVQNTSLGNAGLGVVGLGLLCFPATAPAGGVVLWATGTIGVGLGVTESVLTENPGPAIWSVGGYIAGGAVGGIVARNAPALVGIEGAVNYNWAAGRFYGAGGRFVGTQAGATVYSAANGADAVISTVIEQVGNSANNNGVGR